MSLVDDRAGRVSGRASPIFTHLVFSSTTTLFGCVTTAARIEPELFVLNSMAYPGSLFSVNSVPPLGVNSNLCCLRVDTTNLLLHRSTVIRLSESLYSPVNR